MRFMSGSVKGHSDLSQQPYGLRGELGSRQDQ